MSLLMYKLQLFSCFAMYYVSLDGMRLLTYSMNLITSVLEGGTDLPLFLLFSLGLAANTSFHCL